MSHKENFPSEFAGHQAPGSPAGVVLPDYKNSRWPKYYLFRAAKAFDLANSHHEEIGRLRARIDLLEQKYDTQIELYTEEIANDHTAKYYQERSRKRIRDDITERLQFDYPHLAYNPATHSPTVQRRQNLNDSGSETELQEPASPPPNKRQRVGTQAGPQEPESHSDYPERRSQASGTFPGPVDVCCDD